MKSLSSANHADQDPRWAAIAARDPEADGGFVYSVRSTGVYCKPSCAARLANPRNVAFHAGPADAEAAGFRPCKRCKPDQADPRNGLIENVCRFLDQAEEAPSLAALAARANLSPHHFHRLFKKAIGVTPAAYFQARRAEKVRAALYGGALVTEALYDAGFNSSGRFYAKADSMLGMNPSQFRKGGAGARITFAIGQCSLGAVLAASSDKGVCAILLGDDPQELARDLQDRFPNAELTGGDPAYAATLARVAALADAPASGFDLPLDIRGTAFQQRVWEALRKIPAGETASYSEVAEMIGAPRSTRAVAGACAANAIAIAIPCHRVVRTNGDVSGYRWGVDRKRALLEKEAEAAESSQRNKSSQRVRS